MDYSELLANIKETMRSKGVSQKELAERLCVSQATVSGTLNRNMNIQSLLKIADALDVLPSDLFIDNNATTPPDLSPTPPAAEIICPHCGKKIGLNIDQTNCEE